MHTQLQIVGLPWAAAVGAGGAFLAEGRYKGIVFEEVAEGVELSSLVASQGTSTGTIEYFYVEVPGEPASAAEEAALLQAAGAKGEGGTPRVRRLLHRVPQGVRHPIQFGREVLCRLLNAPDRIQWKNCAVGVEVETAQAAAFREGFAQWDFTLTM